MFDRPLAIDPVGCGCTGCMTGEYESLDNASFWEIKALLEGRIGNNTGIDIESWVKSYMFRMPRAFQDEAQSGKTGD